LQWGQGFDYELVPIQKMQFLANTGRIFEDKLQQGKCRIVLNRDLGNMQQ